MELLAKTAIRKRRKEIKTITPSHSTKKKGNAIKESIENRKTKSCRTKLG
jgi:hypothetical protein